MKLPAVKVIPHEKQADFFKFAFTPEQLFEVQSFLKKHSEKPGYVSVELGSPERHGTDRQNKLFHKLCSEYWQFIQIQGGHVDIKYTSAFDVKTSIKLKIKGVKTYKCYLNGHWHSFDKLDDVPEYMHHVTLGEPYSWTEFNRKNRTDAIKLLVDEMDADGVNTQMFKDLIRERDDLYKEMSERKY